MSRKAMPAVLTPDGFIDPESVGDIHWHHRFEAPTIPASMIVDIRDNRRFALARSLYEDGHLQFIGRSGQSRVGMHVEQTDGTEMEFSSGRVVVPVDIVSLSKARIDQDDQADEVLGVLHQMISESRRQVSVGRLLLARPDHALDKSQLADATASHLLKFTQQFNFDENVQEDGLVELPLEDIHYVFCRENYDDEAQRSVIRFGKHALYGLQALEHGLPNTMDPQEFMVGGIRLSIGPFMAVIEPETNDPEVMHLAARVLDGVRTTGLKAVRQVELFNNGITKKSLADIRVKLRIYQATPEVEKVSRSVVNDRTIERGVSFADIVDLEHHPEKLMRIMHHIAPNPAQDGVYGYLVGPNRFKELSFLANETFQNRNLTMIAPKFAVGDPKYASPSREVSFVHDVAASLQYVGREQNESRVLFSNAFPDPDVMQSMSTEGVSVFVAHDVQISPEAYVTNHSDSNQSPKNDVWFNEELYAAFKRLHAQGSQMLLHRHAMEDPFHAGNLLPEEIMEWHERGLWVRPEQKERLEGIDTVMAMYGSHVKGMQDVLRNDLASFSKRMQKRFGSSLAYIHGKGPGVMYIADDVARNLSNYTNGEQEDIFTIGVGIGAEKIGQLPNPHPHAQLDFHTQDRLVRQKIMNDRSTFNLFNIGGSGTLEEIAVTICSQKVLKNLPAPLLFVDTQGLGRDGAHLWSELEFMIQTMCEQKRVNSDENGPVDVQLLQSYVQKFIHVVQTYDEAADVIERFADDPVTYYLETGIPHADLVRAYGEAAHNAVETGFPIPEWLSPDRVLNDQRWR